MKLIDFEAAFHNIGTTKVMHHCCKVNRNDRLAIKRSSFSLNYQQSIVANRTYLDNVGEVFKWHLTVQMRIFTNKQTACCKHLLLNNTVLIQLTDLRIFSVSKFILGNKIYFLMSSYHMSHMVFVG